MSEELETIKSLVAACTQEERSALKAYLSRISPHRLEQAWDVSADTILNAIERSSDLTKRGVRGIIAEAVFVSEVAPTVAGIGWQAIEIEGELPFDALLRKSDKTARIQVKLQRLEEGVPKLYYPRHYVAGSLFVVEVQKTRTGVKTAKKKLIGSDEVLNATENVTVKTRPYSFGDFDILAVNMHPSTRDWSSFRYTLASWLIPRPADQALIEIFQPVAATPNDAWTDNLSTCLGWLESGLRRRVLDEPLHLRKSRPNREGAGG